MTDHDCTEFDYAWLIPQWKPLHWLYHFTERHPLAYSLTVPLWMGRYYWRQWQEERRFAGRWSAAECAGQGHEPADHINPGDVR